MISKLRKIGLSEKESLIYLQLVKSGESLANSIAKQTSTNRTVTYNILQQLIEKGLVSYIKKDGKRYYQASSFDSLYSNIKEKEIIVSDLIKELSSFGSKDYSQPKVEIFEGLAGIRNLFQQIVKSKELRVLNATGLIFDNLKYEAGHIVKEIENKIDTKIIANEYMKNTPLISFKKLKIRYLPRKVDYYATTFIFNEVVAIQLLKEKPIVIKIESRDIAEGYKIDFDLLWKIAKK